MTPIILAAFLCERREGFSSDLSRWTLRGGSLITERKDR